MLCHGIVYATYADLVPARCPLRRCPLPTRLTQAHPDLDCVVLNAGVQYVMDFSKPWTVDMAKIQKEITINYVSMVALTHAFLPFFQQKSLQQEVAFI